MNQSDSTTSSPTAPDKTDTIVLLQLARAGDREAMEKLFARYQSRLLKVARKHLGGKLREFLDSMDVVQGVNEVLYRKLPELEVADREMLLRWLTRVVVNQIRSAHDFHAAMKRGADRIQPLETRGDQSNPSHAHPSDPKQVDPQEAAAHNESVELLRTAIRLLPKDWQTVVRRRDFEGVAWAGIVAEVGRGEGAVRQMHRRAWIRLRELIGSELDGRGDLR